ncbi:diguanylate cyclase (GGDEF)-like protein [Pararhizobium capsulatum DSM 1112]|uniref:diguanylate cyclase n=1 Tax=Pararhizobium capsulatum DSM 1112 TaxID=1121113 RepID=A0ABU0BRP6_9HYPH|nr:GGDEF domain-containing protein [Pararhizobium capsulatum]MDQ0320909.1 diguanylate cyclase (GGDEF)-like protein [Pararhizobium capsulatum DSM 1112]
MDILLTIAAMSLAVMLPVLVSLRTSGAPGVLSFGLGCLFALLFISSALLADILPNVMNMPLGTMMMVASCLMILSGIREFLGRPALRPVHVASVLVTIAALIVLAAHETHIASSVLASATACGLFLLVGVTLVLRWRKERAIAPYLVFSALTIFAIAALNGLRVAALVGGNEHLLQGINPQELAHQLQTACMLGLPIFFLGLILMQHGWMIANLRNLVAHDDLTGALSRRAFLEQAEALFSNATTVGAPMAFMLLDIDRFKQINDYHGHAGGDRALAHFTGVIQSCLRQRGILGRLGGEEFGVVLNSVGRIEVSELAASICRAVRENPASLDDGTKIALSVSIGIAISEPRRSLNEIISHADMALYEAKATGRDRFCTADSFPAPASASARALAGAAAQLRAAAKGPYIPPLSETG